MIFLLFYISVADNMHFTHEQLGWVLEALILIMIIINDRACLNFSPHAFSSEDIAAEPSSSFPSEGLLPCA